MLDSNISKIQPKGHSIQFRIYAEDPFQDFKPSLGKISHMFTTHQELEVEVDSHAESGTVVSPFYDAMLAKIIISGSSERRGQF